MAHNTFFTAEEAAKQLGLSKQTLFRYEKREIFPHPRRNLINRWRQYSYEDINKLKEILRGNIG